MVVILLAPLPCPCLMFAGTSMVAEEHIAATVDRAARTVPDVEHYFLATVSRLLFP